MKKFSAEEYLEIRTLGGGKREYRGDFVPPWEELRKPLKEPKETGVKPVMVMFCRGCGMCANLRRVDADFFAQEAKKKLPPDDADLFVNDSDSGEKIPLFWVDISEHCADCGTGYAGVRIRSTIIDSSQTHIT